MMRLGAPPQKVVITKNEWIAKKVYTSGRCSTNLINLIAVLGMVTAADALVHQNTFSILTMHIIFLSVLPCL